MGTADPSALWTSPASASCSRSPPPSACAASCGRAARSCARWRTACTSPPRCWRRACSCSTSTAHDVRQQRRRADPQHEPRRAARPPRPRRPLALPARGRLPLAGRLAPERRNAADRALLALGDDRRAQDERRGDVDLAQLTTRLDEHGRQCGAIATFADISERRTILEQLRHQAHHDQLTDLANRRLFHKELDRAISAPSVTGARSRSSTWSSTASSRSTTRSATRRRRGAAHAGRAARRRGARRGADLALRRRRVRGAAQRAAPSRPPRCRRSWSGCASRSPSRSASRRSR